MQKSPSGMRMKLKMKRKGKADKQTNGYFCKITADNEKKKSATHMTICFPPSIPMLAANTVLGLSDIYPNRTFLLIWPIEQLYFRLTIQPIIWFLKINLSEIWHRCSNGLGEN